MPSAISIIATLLTVLAPTSDPQFDRIVIDNDFPGAYQVEVADVNGDKKPDIIAVGGGTCAWYENPTWKKRVITTPKQTPGIISSATADIDGDGKAEVAIAYEFAMNTPKTGKLLLAVQGATDDDAWTLKPIADYGSIHRLRWTDFDRDGKPELVVAGIFGPAAKPPDYKDFAKLTVFSIEGNFRQGDWKFEAHHVADRPILHAIRILEETTFSAIVTADNLGVAVIMTDPRFKKGLKEWIALSLISGTEGNAPKRGASEVQLGDIKGKKIGFVATLEPWHGNQVAITSCRTKIFNPQEPAKPFDRIVIDDTLDDGHALWVADVDGDGDDEVFAGHRGKDHRVSMYKFDGKTWNKTVLDREIAAQDLRGGDLNGDGKPDVVAVGGSTHNVVLYRVK